MTDDDYLRAFPWVAPVGSRQHWFCQDCMNRLGLVTTHTFAYAGTCYACGRWSRTRIDSCWVAPALRLKRAKPQYLGGVDKPDHTRDDSRRMVGVSTQSQPKKKRLVWRIHQPSKPLTIRVVRKKRMAKVLKLASSKKAAEVAAAPAKGKGAAAPAKVKKEKSAKSGRFVGTTSGLGVLAFQNKTIFENAKRKETDEQLAKRWRDEFPQAIATYTAETVNSVRNLVNRGKHGNPDQIPAKPLHGFDESGNPIPLWGDKKAAKEAEQEAKRAAEERAAQKAAAKGAKKLAKA